MNVIDARVAEHRALVAFLRDHGEISMASDVEGDFRKVLVVSAASFIEKRIVDALHTFAGKVDDPRVVAVLKNSAFKRDKFSSLFQWGDNNVNGFLRLFGDDFKVALNKDIGARPGLPDGMKAFLKLGHHRNRLVHNDFADLTSDQTVDEVYALYAAAKAFVDYLCDRLCG
jgi:hypothetical protein